MTDTSYIYNAKTDKDYLEQIGTFVKQKRIAKNLSQSQTAKNANISRSTLSLLENGENVNLLSLIQVLRVLDLLNVLDSFTLSNQISPIEYTKLQKKRRQRASKVEDNPDEHYEW